MHLYTEDDLCVCRLETSRDDFRVRSEVLERDVADLQHRNEELTSLAQEAQTLKDEMDILRYKHTFIRFTLYLSLSTHIIVPLRALQQKKTHEKFKYNK